MTDEQIKARESMQQLLAGLETIILGKDLFLEQILIGFFAGGHILLEDVPGLGKTTIAKALTQLIVGARVARIQCTPDLLPYDITGVEVYNTSNGCFKFQPGPLFSDIVLVDELNRAPSKTQSALLEAMAEAHVTVSNQTYPLSPLFFVIATQNPAEAESTYRLPLAELDRFLFRLSIGYPDLETEIKLAQNSGMQQHLSTLTPILTIEAIQYVRKLSAEVFCADKLIAMAVKIAQFTRTAPGVVCGVSPRGPIELIKTAKVRALWQGRNYVNEEDIMALISICYTHRLVMEPGSPSGDAFLAAHITPFLNEALLA